jgi:hypothetical protein
MHDATPEEPCRDIMPHCTNSYIQAFFSSTNEIFSLTSDSGSIIVMSVSRPSPLAPSLGHIISKLSSVWSFFAHICLALYYLSRWQAIPPVPKNYAAGLAGGSMHLVIHATSRPARHLHWRAPLCPDVVIREFNVDRTRRLRLEPSRQTRT